MFGVVAGFIFYGFKTLVVRAAGVAGVVLPPSRRPRRRRIRATMSSQSAAAA